MKPEHMFAAALVPPALGSLTGYLLSNPGQELAGTSYGLKQGTNLLLSGVTGGLLGSTLGRAVNENLTDILSGHDTSDSARTHAQGRGSLIGGILGTAHTSKYFYNKLRDAYGEEKLKEIFGTPNE
jgi:hypothetical protein